MAGVTTNGAPYPDLNDKPEDIPGAIQALAEWVDPRTAGVPVVTVLPASAADGDLVDLDVGAYAGGRHGLWRFRYSAAQADAYKWMFVGGPPLFDKVDSRGTIGPGGANNWVTLSTTDVAGPDIILPVRGFYLLEFGATIDSASDGQVAQAGVSKVGSDPSDDDTATNANSHLISVAGANFPGDTEYLAGVHVRLMYRCSGTGGTASYQRRWLRATPVSARP